MRLADAAVDAAGRAKMGKTSEATNAFLRVQEEIKLTGPPRPRKGTLDENLPDPITALKNATKKDEKSIGTLAKFNKALKLPPPVSHLC